MKWYVWLWQMSLINAKHSLSHWIIHPIFTLDFLLNILQLNQEMRIKRFNTFKNAYELHSSSVNSHEL